MAGEEKAWRPGAQSPQPLAPAWPGGRGDVFQAAGAFGTDGATGITAGGDRGPERTPA